MVTGPPQVRSYWWAGGGGGGNIFQYRAPLKAFEAIRKRTRLNYKKQYQITRYKNTRVSFTIKSLHISRKFKYMLFISNAFFISASLLLNFFMN